MGASRWGMGSTHHRKLRTTARDQPAGGLAIVGRPFPNMTSVAKMVPIVDSDA